MSEPAPRPRPDADPWEALRQVTPARIGLERHGTGLSTRTTLELGTAHALARDAVHIPLDTDVLADDLARRGFGRPRVLASAAANRAAYLARPDLGRRLAGNLQLDTGQNPPDLALIVCDGLSSTAVQRHAAPLLSHLRGVLDPTVSLSDPIVCLQARVAIGDHIAAGLRAPLVLVLIGERPGLSSHDSLGAYLTWQARPGTTDAHRYCVSNIRPGGLTYEAAADAIRRLVDRARAEGRTGVG